MSNQRPNTVIILFFLIWEGIILLGESVLKGLIALFTGKIIPLKTSRFLQLWHWAIMTGPKGFWRFPRAINIGRIISTCIQVIFYPIRRGK